ncbi:MAG: hypothetical protein LAO51_13530 [Acidobacteriia bacterium]|nr:hypothetical protein [Terriglobia bacterium]
MKTTTMILGAAGLALAVGLVAVAGTADHGGHGGHGPHGAEGPLAVPQMVAWLVDGALDGLGVSDEQRGRVLAVKDRVMSQAQALHAEHAATHEEFKRQWDADRMDAARLHALVDAHGGPSPGAPRRGGRGGGSSRHLDPRAEAGADGAAGGDARGEVIIIRA